THLMLIHRTTSKRSRQAYLAWPFSPEYSSQRGTCFSFPGFSAAVRYPEPRSFPETARRTGFLRHSALFATRPALPSFYLSISCVPLLGIKRDQIQIHTRTHCRCDRDSFHVPALHCSRPRLHDRVNQRVGIFTELIFAEFDFSDGRVNDSC